MFSNPPSDWFWLAFSWAVIIALVAWAYIHFSRKAAISQTRLARLEKDGVKASGTIISVKDTGVTLNENPQINITFRVTPDNAPAFEASAKVFVSRLEIPHEGEQYEVWYDPADVTNFGFGQRLGPATSSTSAADPVSLIERALHLRESGALSQEEFESLKRQVLGS